MADEGGGPAGRHHATDHRVRLRDRERHRAQADHHPAGKVMVHGRANAVSPLPQHRAVLETVRVAMDASVTSETIQGVLGPHASAAWKGTPPLARARPGQLEQL